MKKKRKIKKALDSGTPRKEIQEKFKRSAKLVSVVHKTPMKKLKQVPQNRRETSRNK